MWRSKIIRLLLMSTVVAGIGACNKDHRIWTKSVTLPGAEWEMRNTLIFQPDTPSLEGKTPRKLLMFVKYDENANMTTLPLIVETESSVSGHEYSLDSIKLKLFDERGLPLGKGNFGIYEKTDTFNLRYQMVPGWTMAVKPASMAEVPKGIIAFGIKILP